MLSDLLVDVRHGQLRLDDHDDDAEHAEDERVVADSLPLLEQRLPLPEAVPDIRLVLPCDGQKLTGLVLVLALSAWFSFLCNQ